eukprot:TRINITY_DN65913_c0_g1_i1.p1 TRINITY_DN65913_c0_g1~~TRINITY_DN65913_c0_g1_i1.p1  ORF type:complete len:311 (-),score=53.75 TRINITY_DN65913_c0_g1_i1:13-945(-)
MEEAQLDFAVQACEEKHGELRLSWSQSELATAPFFAAEVSQKADLITQHFELHGCCIVEEVLSAGQCDNLAAFVDSQLLEARRFVTESGHDETTYVGEVFGKLRCRHQRWDVKLPMEKLVADAMGSLGSALGDLVKSHLGEDALLTELSCIISDPGAPQQPLHSDSRSHDPGMLSVLIALQSVTPDMGPTVLCPGTHCLAGSNMLAEVKPHANEASAHVNGYQDEAIEALKGVHLSCRPGTALVYDSRLIHCGGANMPESRGGGRRRMLVATFAAPRKVPRGSACTIRRDVIGRFRLRDFLSVPDGSVGC